MDSDHSAPALHRIAVGPRHNVRGFGGANAAPCVFEVLELREALLRRYDTDAHHLLYVVPDMGRQPRINKGGLPYWKGTVPQVEALVADVDNPGHGPWDEELRKAEVEQRHSLGLLQTVGTFYTRRGRHLVQPLTTPIPVNEIEPYIRRWHAELLDAGVDVDTTAKDWTRLFRMPRVRRDGQPFEPEVLDLSRMRPVQLEPIRVQAFVPGDKPANDNAPAQLPDIDWAKHAPAAWRDRIPVLADAMRAVGRDWHEMSLALAGGLLARGVPESQLPALSRAISEAISPARDHDDRQRGAETTVQRRLRGEPVAGYSQLRRRWSAVAAALDEVTARKRDAEVRAEAKLPADVTLLPRDRLHDRLLEVYRQAPAGVSLIKADCGLGKSHVAIRLAAERAADGRRQGAKTAISVDKTSLAEQTVSEGAKQGVDFARAFGKLALRDADGKPLCIHAEAAEPLVAGGQAIDWLFCQGQGAEPCERFDSCLARRGYEGPDDARVLVGPHALLGKLADHAGKTGTLFIDESPSALEVVAITRDDLAETIAQLGSFASDYAAAVRPILERLAEWLTVGETGRAFPMRHVLGADADDLAATLTASLDEDRPNQPPPMTMLAGRRSMAQSSFARLVAGASRVLKPIVRGVAHDQTMVARITERDGQRQLMLTALNDRLDQAITRQGQTIILDANADLLAPALERRLGYRPPVHNFSADDGARITRTQILLGGCTRSNWFPAGKLDPTRVTSALRQALTWAAEDPTTKTLGIISWKAVVDALRAVRSADYANADADWQGSGQPAVELAEARRALGPLLATWPGSIVWGHYFGLRGLNYMRDVDALITLGSPWENIDELRHEIDYLGLDDDWQTRGKAKCQAELEQAHGRLRPIHRARPARALHIGYETPGGHAWRGAQVEIRAALGGRPKMIAPMTPAEFKALVAQAGGARRVAEALGCSRRLVQLMSNGDRAVSNDNAHLLRELTGKLPANKTLIRDY